MSAPATADRAARAREALASHQVWYHTIELAPGVVTPGYVDHRTITSKVLPDRLDGLRCLDVGTYDGHWAYAMEARGGSVVALDLPNFEATSMPPNNREELLKQNEEWGGELGRGFRLIHDVLGSGVERREADVQRLADVDLGGPFDVVFMGAVLLHLRDPVAALEGLLAQLKPGGRLILLETISVPTTILSPRKPMARFQTLETPFNWWVPNVAALVAWVRTAGFQEVRRKGFLKPPARREMPGRYALIHARRP